MDTCNSDNISKNWQLLAFTFQDKNLMLLIKHNQCPTLNIKHKALGEHCKDYALCLSSYYYLKLN